MNEQEVIDLVTEHSTSVNEAAWHSEKTSLLIVFIGGTAIAITAWATQSVALCAVGTLLTVVAAVSASARVEKNLLKPAEAIRLRAIQGLHDVVQEKFDVNLPSTQNLNDYFSGKMIADVDNRRGKVKVLVRPEGIELSLLEEFVPVTTKA